MVKNVHKMAEVAGQVHDSGVGDHQQYNQQNTVWSRSVKEYIVTYHHKLYGLTLLPDSELKNVGK